MMYPVRVESVAKRRRPRGALPAELDLGAAVQRNAILTAATQVFAREGINTPRVEDILVATGIARRTFYRYFASKEAVLAALYELWTGDLLRAIDASRAAKPDDPLAGVRAGIDLFLSFFSGRSRVGDGPVKRGGVARAVRELVELAMRSDSLLAPRRKWMRGEIVRMLEAAGRARDRKKRDPFLYYGLLGALEGIALELGDASDAEVERARRVLHELVDQALGVGR
jgi:AcrR family transcriptional regulator